MLALSNEEASVNTLYDQRCIARPKIHQVDIKKYRHLTLCPVTVLLKKHHPDSSPRYAKGYHRKEALPLFYRTREHSSQERIEVEGEPADRGAGC